MGDTYWAHFRSEAEAEAYIAARADWGYGFAIDQRESDGRMSWCVRADQSDTLRKLGQA